MSEQKNTMLNNMLNGLNSLSFYAPLIICMSILLISMFTATMEKASVYFLWFFVITCLRILIFKIHKASSLSNWALYKNQKSFTLRFKSRPMSK